MLRVGIKARLSRLAPTDNMVVTQEPSFIVGRVALVLHAPYDEPGAGDVAWIEPGRARPIADGFEKHEIKGAMHRLEKAQIASAKVFLRVGPSERVGREFATQAVEHALHELLASRFTSTGSAL